MARREAARRDFLLAGGLFFLSACRMMAEVRSTDRLIETPHPDAWHPILRGIIITVLPFEHPDFPSISVDEVFAELFRLFRIEDDEDFAALPKGLTLFNDCSLFERPPAPFLDDERRDLALGRMRDADVGAAIACSVRGDQAAWSTFRERYGSLSFLEQALAGRRAYVSLWGASQLITRRRFYRGMKALVNITAYSMPPFWHTVGYEGPLIERG
jgi:hypothetical protein